MDQMESLTVKAFRAPSEPALCDEFISEHHRVLSEFGIPEGVAKDNSWRHDPFCYVIVAIHPELGMVGGLRLQLDSGKKPLPMEEAINAMDARIIPELKNLREYGNGEVCGLWSANRYPNKGVAALISTAVTAISALVDAGRMVCFVASYTRKYPARNGFIELASVGENGTFQYPTARIRSMAMVNPDTLLLPHCDKDQRNALYSLRLRPLQTRIETPASAPVEVHFDLRVGRAATQPETYLAIAVERLRWAS
jgi:hypothetical protein